jgi:hypothetical protein
MLRAIADRWQRALLAALVTLGLAQVGYAFLASARTPAAGSIDLVCGAWDHEAKTAIALLLSEPVALAGFGLDDALRQLDRARQHCRAGRVGLAHEDFLAVRAFQPFLPRPGSAPAVSQSREGVP